MKKNISINISGIIFHIEEDGYEKLRSYLDTINTYFSAYEDSAEIIADIESRIAEIFLSKLKEGKQIITAIDVQNLMATMGSIQDFEAIEEDPKFQREEQKQSNPEENYEQYHEPYVPKKLYRDNNRKILGGVAAGIANYFQLDPLWIRLILIILFFDVFISFSIGSIVVIGYIVCWIVIPASNSIEEDRKVKKMYRNPDDKVLGGVSGGLAAYFGIDATFIRLLFVVSIFLGGAGVVIYFILWIITPEAKSLTEKMQMQGEPVTLSNIESNIKKSLNVKDGEDENILVKILLFPFRLIAIVFAGIGKALGPLLLFVVEAIRVLFGILIIISAASLLFLLFTSSGILFGLVGEEFFFPNLIGDFPLDLIVKSFSALTFIALFTALAIPNIALVLLGISILAKRKVANATISWSLFALWIISAITLAFTIPGTIKSFSSKASEREVTEYHLNGKTAVFTTNNRGLEDYRQTSIRLLGHSDTSFKLVQKYFSKGSSHRDALENANMIAYDVLLEDSVFSFDSNIRFKEDAVFRDQGLEMILYVPYNQPFVIKDDFRHLVGNSLYHTDYFDDQMAEKRWMFTEEGLICVSCPQNETEEDDEIMEKSTTDENTVSETYKDFNSLNIEGFFEIVVTKGETHSVVFSGDKEALENVSTTQSGNSLNIGFDDYSIQNNFIKPRIKIAITMPELEEVEFSGITESYIGGFKSDNLGVNLSGSARAEFQIEAENLEIEMHGDSKLTLSGSGNYLTADISGASRLLAEEYIVDKASIEASGISTATVHAKDLVHSNTSGASSVENVYEGNTTASKKKNTGFYLSKAPFIYFFTLLKSGLLNETTTFDSFIKEN